MHDLVVFLLAWAAVTIALLVLAARADAHVRVRRRAISRAQLRNVPPRNRHEWPAAIDATIRAGSSPMVVS